MAESIKKLIVPIRAFMKKCKEDNLSAIAGQSSFYFILAFVPLIMFAVSLMQNFQITITALEEFLKTVLNDRYYSYISEYLSNAYSDYSGISIITLTVTLYSASKGMHALIDGLNRIHAVHHRGNWFMMRLRAMVMTLVLIVVLIITMSVCVMGSTLNELLLPWLRRMPMIVGIIYHLRYLFVYMYLVLMFALIYQSAPNIPKETRKEYGILNQLPGAYLGATSWFVLSVGISVYVDDFGGFSIYGGLTRLAVIMVWLYLCLEFFMYGAQVNFVYHDVIKNINDRYLLFFKKGRSKKTK